MDGAPALLESWAIRGAAGTPGSAVPLKGMPFIGVPFAWSAVRVAAAQSR